MRSVISRYGKAALSLLFLTALYLFWWLRVPFLLSYHEQYQLFLFTADYLCQALRIPGGTAVNLKDLLSVIGVISDDPETKMRNKNRERLCDELRWLRQVLL